MGVKQGRSTRREGDAVEPQQQFIGDGGKVDPAGEAKRRPMAVCGGVGIGGRDLPTPERSAAAAGRQPQRLRQDNASVGRDLLSVHRYPAGGDIKRPRRGIVEPDLLAAEQHIFEQPDFMRHARRPHSSSFRSAMGSKGAVKRPVGRMKS